MSTPPPPYQNQPPYPQQQQYGYPQQPQPQAPYGHPQQPQAPYGHPQQPHSPQQPQPPRGPQGPRPGGLGRALKSAVVMIAVVGAVGYWVWDYNTNPNGGKAKEEASVAAQNPRTGDCVKVADPKGEPVPTVVDCGSPEAEYKMGDQVFGEDECSPKYDYGIRVHSNHRSMDYTMCFTKV